MNLINAPFSFIQFTAGSSPSDCDYLLPVALNGDLKFQIVIGTDSISDNNAVVAHTQKLYMVNSGAVITDESSLSTNTLYAQDDFFSAVQIGDQKALLCWSAAITGIEEMADETCFRLCMRIDDGTTVLYFLSNCFQKISDTKYNNTLEYYATADNYGFSYCDGCSNKVRLPFYLGGPQVKEDQTVYIFSNGTRKLTSYQAGKIYNIIIGTVPEDIHNKITTALAHDIVNIESPRYTGGIRKDGDYTIGWDRNEDLTAPATTKAYAVPYIVVNDNCAECVDYVPCVAPTIPSFTLGTASEGVVYTKTISLAGSVPFTLSALTKPAWMNITVSGSTVTLSGTPGSGDDGTGIAVSFTVTNACGSVDGSGTIDVTCDAVAISGSPSLPDASTFTVYSYTFSVTGTAPFTLSSITKPSWMTIAVSGSSINFSGTPGGSDEATGVSVAFTINNPCGSVDFSDTIDVVSGGAIFTTPTGSTGDEYTQSEDFNLLGNPDSVVTVTLTTLTNPNGGTVKVNGSIAAESDTWNFTLDGSGAASFTVLLTLVSNPGTGIVAVFTITAVSSGGIGTPDNYSISKTYS